MGGKIIVDFGQIIEPKNLRLVLRVAVDLGGRDRLGIIDDVAQEVTLGAQFVKGRE